MQFWSDQLLSGLLAFLGCVGQILGAKDITLSVALPTAAICQEQNRDSIFGASRSTSVHALGKAC